MTQERNPDLDRANARHLDDNRKWAREFASPEGLERHEAAYDRLVARVGYDPLAEADGGVTE